MKILLHNEASGVHANLRDGLRILGHEATLLMTSGQTAQGRPADVITGTDRAGWVGRVARHIVPLYTYRRFLNYDIISFVMGLSMLPGRAIRYLDIPNLKKEGAQLSYYGVGCDEVSLLRVREDAKNLRCCASCIQFDVLGQQCAKTTLSMREKASSYGQHFDFSVSPSYVYSHCHTFFPNAAHAAIQFPINLGSLPFLPSKSKHKPLIVHSPTRRGFKGTDVVMRAMLILSMRRQDFEFVLVEGLAHQDYIAAMRDCDIYIDQVLSEHGAGMAALENLACGKIVISGNGFKNWNEFRFNEESPIIPASQDPETLAEMLSELLDNKHTFPSAAEVGRAFVERHHDHVTIAERFTSLWRTGSS